MRRAESSVQLTVVPLEEPVVGEEELHCYLPKSKSCVEFRDHDLRPSSLFLKKTKGSNDEDDLEPLYLPPSSSCHCLDEYIQSSVPLVASRSQELMSAAADVCSEEDEEGANQFHQKRCLNVLQGEVAHASSEQAEVLVSGEATTCHVVALRSTKSESKPLTSLAHVDQSYEDCLEAMIQEHLDHHLKEKQSLLEDDDFGFYVDDDDDGQAVLLTEDAEVDKEGSSNFFPTFEELRHTVSMPALHSTDEEEPIEMELHIAGGFLDKEGTSQKLSTSLLERFDELAHKYRDRLRISLSTAAISSMNTTQEDAPRCRGLGIDTKTGNVFPVQRPVPKHIEGPAVAIRSARVFCEETEAEASRLSVIHDTKSRNGEIRVQPFSYKADRDLLHALLNVPDDVLKSVSSTSPEHESEDFCTNFRRTLSFVQTNPKPESVFQGRPLIFTRSMVNMNEWAAVA